MDFEIVQLPASFVAGLTVPLAGREVSRRDLDLVNYTWDRYLARNKNVPRVAAYVAQGDRSAAVLGYECASPDDVDHGDVLTRIPAATYAKFVIDGKPYDLTRTAWAEVTKAETEGRISRTHETDIERFRDATGVEVYVSITS